jgi:2-phosphosulfolactate phosphatase
VIWDQAEYDLRCEWGLAGVQTLAPISDVLIVVDVLVFSTAVDIAVARGASVLPYRWRDSSAEAFAKSKGALLASPRSAGGYSLSPPSLQSIPAGTALVLPSPNGSTLCLMAGAATTFTACLRNCRAVAAHACACGSRIAVVPAGEQWGDGALRPAIEDLIGAERSWPVCRAGHRPRPKRLLPHSNVSSTICTMRWPAARRARNWWRGDLRATSN